LLRPEGATDLIGNPVGRRHHCFGDVAYQIKLYTQKR
jgi:hypothetical protein